jgi:hypothetical protein
MMTPPRRAATVGRPSASGPRRRAYAALLAAVCLGALAAPMTASATTGTQTDRHAVVTLTDKGATWTHEGSKFELTTGTTVRVQVLNKTSQPHWFKLGTRKTKTIVAGASYTFFYLFDTPGEISWQVGLGNVGAAAFHGSVKVVFPPSFH